MIAREADAEHLVQVAEAERPHRHLGDAARTP